MQNVSEVKELLMFWGDFYIADHFSGESLLLFFW